MSLYPPTLTEARIALWLLKDSLKIWKKRAFETGILPPKTDAVKVLIWVSTIDYFLTGHPRQASTRESDLRNAEEVLQGSPWVVHLSDGGYSRFGVDLLDEPHVWLDRGASLPKVIERWEDLNRRKI